MFLITGADNDLGGSGDEEEFTCSRIPAKFTGNNSRGAGGARVVAIDRVDIRTVAYLKRILWGGVFERCGGTECGAARGSNSAVAAVCHHYNAQLT